MRRHDSLGELFQMGIVQPDVWRSVALHKPVRDFPNAVFAELPAPKHLG